MLGQQRPEGSLFQLVTVEELVPRDHFLRRLDAAIDFSFIRERVRGLYCEDNGRPSVDPELALRMFILGYLYNLSEHRLCEEIAMHAGFRWFCRLNFHDPVPDRSTLVKLRRGRWGKNGVFRDVMRQVVQACIDAGLVSGGILVADGTLVNARAATNSLEPIQPPISIEAYLERLDAEADNLDPPRDDDAPPSPPSTSGTSRRAGDPNFRGERFTNQTHRSKTDPDARLYTKGSHQEAKLRYMVHDLMDAKSGVIVATGAIRCAGDAERRACIENLDAAIALGMDPVYLLADGGYTATGFLQQVLARGVEPLVPIQGVLEPLPTWQRRTFNLDHQRKRRAKIEAVACRNHVRQLRDSAIYKETYPLRTRMEHRFAEAKEWHGMDRARGYGLMAMDIQAQMTATVQNLKRLVRWTRRKPKAATQAMTESKRAMERLRVSTMSAKSMVHLPHLLSRLQSILPTSSLIPGFLV